MVATTSAEQFGQLKQQILDFDERAKADREALEDEFRARLAAFDDEMRAGRKTLVEKLKEFLVAERASIEKDRANLAAEQAAFEKEARSLITSKLRSVELELSGSSVIFGSDERFLRKRVIAVMKTRPSHAWNRKELMANGVAASSSAVLGATLAHLVKKGTVIKSQRGRYNISPEC